MASACHQRKLTTSNNEWLTCGSITTWKTRMEKRQIQARLIEKGSNFRQFAISHKYVPRTVTQVVDRWAGSSTLPCGRLTFCILKDLSRFIDQEVLPGILTESVEEPSKEIARKQ